MTSSDESVPDERLRRARSLKGWSQAELAEQVGTSYEMVSRWERGITVPSPYYRERLCAVLGQSAKELGLLRSRPDAFTPLPSPLVLLASSHRDAEKPLVSRLIREAIELASGYQRPVCGVWIEGQRWQEYLPKGSGTLAALIDARTSDGPVLIGEIATALERAGLTSPDNNRPTSVDAEGHVLVRYLPTSAQQPQAVGST